MGAIMISKDRVDYWSDNYRAKQQGDSIPIPLERHYRRTFSKKTVLEIGPGEGRQFDFAWSFTKQISVADISEKVLSLERYEKAVDRFLIKSYDDDFKRKFSIIHFWYVLHHVKNCELKSFFDFVVRHLEPRGLILFNTPVLGYPDPAYGDDGILTTAHDLESVADVLDENFFWRADRSEYRNSNGYVIMANLK